MAYTLEEVESILETDEEERFVRLVVPKTEYTEELDVRGKRLIDLNMDDGILVKQYAGFLYRQIGQSE